MKVYTRLITKTQFLCFLSLSLFVLGNLGNDWTDFHGTKWQISDITINFVYFHFRYLNNKFFGAGKRGGRHQKAREHEKARDQARAKSRAYSKYNIFQFNCNYVQVHYSLSRAIDMFFVTERGSLNHYKNEQLFVVKVFLF